MTDPRAPGVLALDACCVEPSVALGVAHVSLDAEYHPALEQAWLHGAEHLRAARFAVAHARADYLAGRIAAKHAAATLVSAVPSPSQWEIRPGQFERPGLEHQFPGRAVSIAHADGVGLALIHPRDMRCGIDLEPLDREADDVIATQVTAEEAAWARAGRDAEAQRMRWLLLWTAREALGKGHGTGLLEPERLCATTKWIQDTAGWSAEFAGDETTRVRSVVAGGFVASMVLPVTIDGEPLARRLAAALLR